jgi:hypothetical protein
MAIKERSGYFYLYFRPFKSKQIGLKLDVTTREKGSDLLLAHP